MGDAESSASWSSSTSGIWIGESTGFRVPEHLDQGKDMTLNCIITGKEKIEIEIVKPHVTNLEVVQRLRSGRYKLSKDNEWIVQERGNQIAKITSRLGSSKASGWQMPISWPEKGTFWDWFAKADGRNGFLPNSFMFITFASVFIALIKFEGDAWGVAYLGIATSPFFVWTILRSVFVTKRYKKGGGTT
jgi:hypothetical protein